LRVLKKSWTSWNVEGHVLGPRKKLPEDSVRRHVVLPVLSLGIERVRINLQRVVSQHVALIKLKAPPPVRSFRGAETTNQTQSQNVPRGRGQGCWTCGKLGCHSLLHRQNDRQSDVSPPRQVRKQPLMQVNNTPPHRKSGCHVCGKFGCHTIFHDDNGFETDRDDRGFPPLSAPSTTVARHGQQSGNNLR